MVRSLTHPLYPFPRRKQRKDQVQVDPKVILHLFRSNSFYKEMSTFIGSKTGVQCRSHHQKYEGKYKYPHRIIKEEKQRFDTSLYLEVKQTIPKRPLPVEEKEENSISSPKSPIPKEKSAKTVSCQTQIEGVNNILATFDHQNYPQPYMAHPYMNSQPMSFSSYQPWRPVNPMVLNWPHSSSF